MKKQTRILSLLLALLMVCSFNAAAAGLTIVSATCNGADLEGATLPTAGTITLTFSNNVSDESVFFDNSNCVHIRNSAGKSCESAVFSGSDKTSLLLYYSDLATGSYTLEVGKDVKAKNGSKLGTDASYSFTVANPLTVESITVDDAPLGDAEQDGNALIVIQFSRGMTDYAEDNAKLIQVVDEFGTPADYTVISPASKEEKNIVKVQLNDLSGGMYTLVLGKDIKANNGLTLGEDVYATFDVASKPLTFWGRVRMFFANLGVRFSNFFEAIRLFFLRIFGITPAPATPIK